MFSVSYFLRCSSAADSMIANIGCGRALLYLEIALDVSLVHFTFLSRKMDDMNVWVGQSTYWIGCIQSSYLCNHVDFSDELNEL